MNPEEKPTLPPLNSTPVPIVPPIVNSAQTVPVVPVVSNVAGAEYAGFFSRLVAYIIDGILVALITTPISWVFGFVSVFAGKNNYMFFIISFIVQIVISIGILYYYYGIYQHKNGQTIGKKSMHIKVVLVTDGSTPSPLRLLLRETIGKWISAVILLIGFLMPLFDAKKQALHDKLAGTVVIKV